MTDICAGLLLFLFWMRSRVFVGIIKISSSYSQLTTKHFIYTVIIGFDCKIMDTADRASYNEWKYIENLFGVENITHLNT